MKFYKLYITSDSKLSGAWNDGQYAIDLRALNFDTDYEYVLSVETFVVDTAITTSYIITIPDVSLNGTTFSTLNKNIANIVLLNNTQTYSQAITVDTVGSRILDVTGLTQRMINIQLLNANTGALAAVASGTPKWNMVVSIYAKNKKFG